MKYLRNCGKSKMIEHSDSSGSLEPAVKKRKFETKQYPVLQVPPPIPPGEDSSSNSRNQKYLVMEEKKISANQSKIKVLMRRTFAFRRADILNNSRPIKDLLTVYPSLKRVEQVV